MRMDIFHKLNNKSKSCLCLNELINNDCHDSAEPSKSKDLEENNETTDKITNLDYNQDSLSKHGFLYIWTHYIKKPERVHSMPCALWIKLKMLSMGPSQAGWKSMHQGFRIYFVLNPRLMAIEFSCLAGHFCGH